MPLKVPTHGGRSLGNPLPGWAKVLLLLVVALVLRLAAIGYLRSYEHCYGYEHAAIATNFLQGRGFSIRFLGHFGPTSQQAPWYPLLLAAAYRLGGIQSWQAHLGVQLLQAVAGAVSCLLLVWLVRSRLPHRDRVAWAAGWLLAWDPVQIAAAGHLQVLPWAVLALLAVLAWAAGAPIPRGRFPWLASLGLGVLCGLMLLMDPILALAAPPAWWILLRRVAGAGRLFRPRVMAAAVLVPLVAWGVISPWLWRNYRVHGQFVFIKSTFGYAFWQGNNPSSLGTDRLPKGAPAPVWPVAGQSWHQWWRQLNQARHEFLYIDDVLLKPHGYRRFAGLSEPQRSALLGREAWQWIRRHPEQYLRLCAFRLGYFFYADWTHPKASTGPYRLRSVVLWLLVCLGAVALRGELVRWMPLLLTVVFVAAFHTLTIFAPRFGIVVQPLLLPLAGAGLLLVARAAACLLPLGRGGFRFAPAKTHPASDAPPCGNPQPV